ncbi:MAG: transglycosylase SLT domain-containing protein [bacterium]
MKERYTKIKTVIQILFFLFAIGYFALRISAIDKNFQDKMHEYGLIVSRYEAKAQFINLYLPQISERTGSDITAKRILAAVYENSIDHQLGTDRVLAIIDVESDFNPKAKSDAGAIGLMQVMPVTGIYVGSRLGIWIGGDEDLYEIETNIQIGCVFLKDCIDRLGEYNGQGFYYAGRHKKHYREYNDKIAAARKAWRDHGAP